MDDRALAERIERAFLAAENGDPDALRGVLADAPTWHTPGRNVLSGDHMGREQVIRLLRDYRDMTGGSFRAEEVGPVEIRGDRGALHLRTHARREGLSLDIDVDVSFRLEGERVAEVWARPADSGAWDRFWAP